MDPTSVTALATVLSLIGQFVSERRASDQTKFNDFMAWLAETHHDEVRSLLESNVRSTVSIKALLNEQHDAVLQKLASLDQILAALASGVPGFDQLSHALRPDAGLSVQALSILEQFEESGASKVELIECDDGLELLCIGGQVRGIELRDERFAEDDLRTLVELGLLRLDYNSRGDHLFIYTRAASELVRTRKPRRLG
ncbi:hypothetical protein HUS23_03905 [Ectothiorhodospiraceae bacterium 2226]|nr:hypothetical protein HUS23_03905 [Ectothiorhodospiraceae bacterium 2226]